MRLLNSFKNRYPKLTRWILYEFPMVQQNKRVWRAFLKYSELTPQQARLALQPGHFPIVMDLPMYANGQHNCNIAFETVFISKEICQRFEQVDAKNPRMHRFFEAILLHEMVHWGDCKDGVDQAEEEGLLFEGEAYGELMQRYW